MSTATETSTSPSTIQVNSTTSRTPTLRSSCNACADAKIGCTKEKPRCARCVRRDEPCIYAATRRAGRRPCEKRQRSADTPVATRSPKTSRPASTRPRDATMTAAALPSPDIPKSSLEQFSKNEIFPADYSTIFDTIPIAGEISSNAAQNDFEDFWASISPLSNLDQHHQGLSPSQPMSTDVTLNFDPDSVMLEAGMFENKDVDANLFPVDSCQEDDARCSSLRQMSFLSHMTPAPTTPSSWFSSTHEPNMSYIGSGPASEAATERSGSIHSQSTFRTKPPCSCLPGGLNLLSQLTPYSPYSLCVVKSGTSTPEAPPSFEGVLAQNDAAIRAVGDILKCSCTHDDSLLLILSLVIFKTLGWYAAAAASAAPLSEHESDKQLTDVSDDISQIVQPPSTVDNAYGFDGEKPDRIACQLILSKLHRVQRIVESLSRQLMATEKRSRKTKIRGNESRTANAAQNLLFDGPMFSPATSAGLARGLEANLRTRLRELSQGIVDTLLDK